MQVQADATGDRQRTFTRADRLAGLMKRYQRRRTGRIQGHAGAPQIEHVRDAVRGNARGVSGRHLGIDRAKIVGEPVSIVRARDADEHATRAALDAGRLDAAVLKCLPAHFQQQALLRIHLRGFTRRDAEESRIKRGHIANRPGGKRITGAGMILAGMAECFLCPPRRFHRRHQIPSVQQIRPVLFRIGAGEPKRHADDGNFHFCKVYLPRQVKAARCRRVLEHPR